MADSGSLTFDRPDWHAQVDEEVVDPDLEIIDPHHHLWQIPGADYLLENLWADTGSGHRVVKTVFVECHASYRDYGPDHLRPVGETEFVAGLAADSNEGPGARIAGIVAYADLRLGDRLPEVLDAHVETGRGLFRGIRHALSHATHPEVLAFPGGAPAGLSSDEAFRDGVRMLGRLGHTYESWHYHEQMPDFIDLARSAPDTTIILDHFGTPLGVGPWATQRDEIFEQWKVDIAEAARCPNVVAKLGGLAMPDNGYGWHLADRPPTSDEVVSAHRAHYLHTIDHFGPERCMFESNFPVDRVSVSYRVLFNAFKKMVADFSTDERAAMFSGTAERVYRL